MAMKIVNEEQEADSASPCLTEDEQRQLTAWNATQQNFPQDRYIPQLVAARAAETPEVPAVVMGSQGLSYRELNQRANQLAHALRELGVGPGVLVGLCVERSLEMVVGLLGILKAGAAYLPLDASYPVERLAFMLEDAQAPVLLTQRHLLAQLPTHGTRLICFDGDAELLARQSTAEPLVAITGENLAYVIYTSGSTGRPKGVQITHSALLNLVYWHRRAFAVTAADRATQVASPAFDATGWELWPYLTGGASIHMVDEETRISPAVLRDWLVNQRITISFLPTALAESILTLTWPSTTALRFLLTGADALHHYPSAELPFTFINNYGPTEATVVATFGVVPPTIHADMPPSIGRPIDNAQVYILDENLCQVPIGEPGELYIGGAGLAKDYLHRPELTNERFIAHPFSDEPGARLYKTGDRVRFLPDGQIAFMGRIDHQIKIRGFRIEPNEIVAVLNSHPSVHASAVIAREDTPGDKHLVAYLVLAPGEQVTTRDLQEALAEQLPDYMIPAVFVLLEALPTTTNGKVDLAALPAPDATNTAHDEAIALPETPVEKHLATIVASLLKLQQVGIDDNFFMLGGHSLLGTQVIARVAETFGIDLSLRSLFNAPTVRQLAAEIERLIFARLELMSDEEALALLQQGQES